MRGGAGEGRRGHFPQSMETPDAGVHPKRSITLLKARLDAQLPLSCHAHLDRSILREEGTERGVMWILSCYIMEDSKRGVKRVIKRL